MITQDQINAVIVKCRDAQAAATALIAGGGGGGGPPPDPNAYDPKDCYPIGTTGAGQTAPGFTPTIPTVNAKRWSRTATITAIKLDATVCLDEAPAGKLQAYIRSGADGRIPKLLPGGQTNPAVYDGNFAAEVTRWQTVLEGGAVINPPPPPPPPPPPGTSPDGTTVPPAPSITDSAGAVWTRRADGVVLRGGSPPASYELNGTIGIKAGVVRATTPGGRTMKMQGSVWVDV